MTLLEKGDLLINGATYTTDYCVLKPSLWTVCLAEYLKQIIPNISMLVRGHTMYKSFYKESTAVSKFVRSMNMLPSEQEFKLDAKANILYVPDKNIYTTEQVLAEIFYCIKLGTAYEGLPSSLVYFVKECFQSEKIPEAYGVKILPKWVWKDLVTSQMGNPVSTISNIIGHKFIPLTSKRHFVLKEDTIDFYVSKTDYVAAAPRYLLNHVSINDLKDVTIEGGYLSLHHRPLHTYCGKMGYYDGSGYDIVKCR